MEPTMGKMLDAFKHSAPKTLTRAESPTPLSAPAAPPVFDSETDSDMPFIEVGGKNDKLEASPDVLACSVAPTFRASVVQQNGAKPQEVPCAPRIVPSFRSVRLQHAVNSKPQWVFFSPLFASELIVAHDPRHAVCAQYEALLEQILNAVSKRTAPVVCYLGAGANCGTTTTVLNLAITAARDMDRSVTVVDVNDRRPALAQRIGLDQKATEGCWFQARRPANLRFVPWIDRTGHSLESLLHVLRADEGLVFLDGPNVDDVHTDLADLALDGLYLVSADEENRNPLRGFGRTIDGWIIAR
jgi:hypothetical protein